MKNLFLISMLVFSTSTSYAKASYLEGSFEATTLIGAGVGITFIPLGLYDCINKGHESGHPALPCNIVLPGTSMLGGTTAASSLAAAPAAAGPFSGTTTIFIIAAAIHAGYYDMSIRDIPETPEVLEHQVNVLRGDLRDAVEIGLQDNVSAAELVSDVQARMIKIYGSNWKFTDQQVALALYLYY